MYFLPLILHYIIHLVAYTSYILDKLKKETPRLSVFD